MEIRSRLRTVLLMNLAAVIERADESILPAVRPKWNLSNYVVANCFSS